MSATALKESKKPQFFPIRINSVGINVPISFDIYLLVAEKPVLFRKKGDVITPDRMKMLQTHGGDKFLIPEEQRPVYLNSLKSMIHDPSTPTETKAKFIKESAFVHVTELFTKDNISDVVNDSQNMVEEMVSFVSSDVDAVASLMKLSTHDYYTYNHCVDVAVYAIVLAKRIIGTDKRMLMLAGLGGLLHDIGKRRIDLNIINKKSALTPDEWEEIKRHPDYGKQLLKDVPGVPEQAKHVVHEHHENYDGTGYPQGLKEEEISKLARIVTIADVFDALTTNRSYHKAISPSEALNTMYAMQPGKFDPNIFRSFNKNFETAKSGITLPKDFDPCKAPKGYKAS